MDAQKHRPPGSVQLTATTKIRRKPTHESLVGMCALAQHAVEHRDRRQVAGPHTDEGIPRGLLGFGAIGRPQLLTRRVQELLPRLRAGRMAEQRVVVATAQPIVPGTDVDAPTRGRSSAEVSSASTIALSDTVGPTTRYPRSISVDTRCANPAASITALVMGVIVRRSRHDAGVLGPIELVPKVLIGVVGSSFEGLWATPTATCRR